MIKIYGTKEKEKKIIAILAEFQVRAYVSYPIKGRTRKDRKTKLYKITNYPI